jgi:hypothetical protein
MARSRRRAWVVVVAALGLGVLARGASAAPVTFSGAPLNTIDLTGVLGTDWKIANIAGTNDGTPTGSCNFTAPGLSVIDATLDPSGANKSDAFDNGLTLWVDDVIYVSPDTVDVTGATLTSGPVAMSGLNVSVQYDAATMVTPVLRALYTFENPTAAQIDTVIKVLSNFGSDGNTGVVGTSSGDTTFDTGDRWVVTSDDPVTPGDAVVGMAVRGPRFFNASPLRNGNAFSTTAFTCFGNEGNSAQYNLSIPPGQTLSLLFFAQLSVNNAAGLTNADATFGMDSIMFGVPAVNPSVVLLGGLTDDQLVHIVNWNFFGEFDLIGGGPGGSRWFVSERGGTSNGLPVGGTCRFSPGLAITDASLGSQGDAFDEGLTLWVDSHGFVAPLSSTQTGQTFTAGPVSMSGLDVTMQYAAAADSATLRTLATFANPGASDIMADVVLATNVGSDNSTGIRGTSSGDLLFTPADRWVVTSDDPTTPSDPVNIHVISGPNSPPLPPAAVATDVYTCSATPGILADFMLTVPAGQTRRLLFFNGLSPDNTQAATDATAFDTNPVTGGALLSGLAVPDLLQIVNWNFCATASATCDDGDACTDDTCTPGPGCVHGLIARAATFLAVGCRTDALTGDVQGAVAAGKLQTALLKKLQAARAKETKAEMLRAAGKKGPAKRAIVKAIRLLKAFERQLRSKKAKAALSDAQRTAFTQASSDLRADLTTLKTAP